YNKANTLVIQTLFAFSITVLNSFASGFVNVALFGLGDWMSLFIVYFYIIIGFIIIFE
ncbi:hypothetical protein ACJX0J_022211, partial [Zea mays]